MKERFIKFNSTDIWIKCLEDKIYFNLGDSIDAVLDIKNPCQETDILFYSFIRSIIEKEDIKEFEFGMHYSECFLSMEDIIKCLEYIKLFCFCKECVKEYCQHTLLIERKKSFIDFMKTISCNQL